MAIRTRDVGVDLTKRISWGAIFAGAIAALALQLVFGLLGSAFGTGAMDFQEGQPFAGLGTGTVVWSFFSNIIALFVGGWIASRMAGRVRVVDHVLHGVVTWGLASLAMFYILTSAVGSALRGTLGIAGQTVTALGTTVGQVAKNTIGDINVQANVDISDIRAEAKEILRQTEKETLQPENLQDMAEKTQKNLSNTTEEIAEAPQTAGAELNELIDRVFARADRVVSAVDKEAIANVLTARTDMSEAEAEQTAERWATLFEQAKQRVNEVAQNAKQTALATADQVAETVSSLTAWLSVLLMLSAVAAGLGGFVGALADTPRKNEPYRTGTTDEYSTREIA